MNSKKWSVLYHKNCADGFGAAWVASTFLGLKNTRFEPVIHGEPLPKFLHSNILIADFSYPKAVLEQLNIVSDCLVVLDHHKSAAEDLDGLPYCTFDMHRSGAMMTWDYFNAFDMYSNPTPWIIKYVQDRDLWTWKLPHSKEINTYIGSLPNDFYVWTKVNSAGPEAALEAGKAMLMYKKTLIDRIVENKARLVEVKGHKVWCANSAFLQSEIGNVLADRGPFALVYSETGDGRWAYSVRVSAESDFDGSTFAKSFGGGGHRKAAGFVSGTLVHRS